MARVDIPSEIKYYLLMKTLYKLILLLLAGTVYGQSQLPACQGSDSSKWLSCFGSRTYPDSKYVGEFKDGAKNGQGTYTWLDGNKYVGEWKDDTLNGQGTFTWADGEKHMGEWKDGNRHGLGIVYNANGSIKRSGIYKDNKLVTSQYIDPNSFTRIARNSTQLEEDRRKLEGEKRQIASDGSLEQRYETIQNAGSQYDSIRLRSVREGSVFKCGELAYNFLEGYVFIYTFTDDPQTEFLPQTRYTANDNYVRWEFENGTFTRGGVEYRNPPVEMEFNKKALTLVQSDGSRMVKIPCQAVDLQADVQRRKAAASERDKNLGPGRWVDLGGGWWKWSGRDGINISGRPLKEGMISGFIDDSWDYSLGKKK
jgi:hypothetical protein